MKKSPRDNGGAAAITETELVLRPYLEAVRSLMLAKREKQPK
jgi:hypothetical protein